MGRAACLAQAAWVALVGRVVREAPGLLATRRVRWGPHVKGESVSYARLGRRGPAIRARPEPRGSGNVLPAKRPAQAME